MKILIWDTNLATAHAERLKEDGHEVKYFTFWAGTGFPDFMDYVPGKGMVDKSIYFFDDLGWADIVYFPDCGMGDLVDHLREKDKKIVWGAGRGEELELQRWRAVEIMDELKISHPPSEFIIGVDKLEEYLKKSKEPVFVKFDIFRGNQETFGFPKYIPRYDKVLELKLSGLKIDFGPFYNEIPFVVQKKVGEIEPGYDLIFNGEKFLEPCAYGFEIKGAGCQIERFVSTIDDLPKPIKETAVKIIPYLKEVNWRGAISNEGRIGKDTDGKLAVIDWCCYDDKTEILTNNGWKLFKDLNKDDTVATLNPETKEIEYQKPSQFFRYWFDGEMIRIDTKSVDLCITPNHQQWIKTRTGKEKFVRADELRNDYRILRTGIWKGKETEWFILPEYRKEWISGRKMNVKRSYFKPGIKIKMDDWLRFLGIYLAEGNCGSGSVSISQTTKRKEVKEILEKLPFTFSDEAGKMFRISSIQLENYLKQFGKCNEKFVPDYVKELSPRQINIFLDAYCLGDGNIRKKGQREFATTSKRLADDIQELIFKIGNVANIKIERTEGSVMEIFGRKYVRRFDKYIITERVERTEFLIDLAHWKEREVSPYRKEYYRGYVYDVEVPKYHILYVRRNGKPCWSGNSRWFYPGSAMYTIKDLIGNYSETIEKVAKGEDVKIDVKYPYVFAMTLETNDALKNWVDISFDSKWRNRIRFRIACQKDNIYWAVPGFESVVTVVGLGDSPQEAIEDALKIYEKSGVSAFALSKPVDKEVILKELEKAKDFGIDF